MNAQTESDKILSPEYLNWHAKLTGLPDILTDKIRSNLYKKYKKETGHEPWQLPKAVISMPPKPKISDFKPITYEAKPDSELIIKSVLEHFTYLKFRNSFRGIDNYNFASPQPWSSPCPICDGKHGNYGLHGEWYKNETEYVLPATLQ
ncbi:23413_t:CDS:1, partial [Gigaspora rosea]